ncbi:MAG: ABC transporter permease [Candidatus Altiarchaeota archaeon]|nr:ABC transporter permease [Candidatus Altiarchaeota archaeon]
MDKMARLKGIYALWYREYKVFIRERSRVIASIVNPVLWFIIIGGGLGSAVSIGGIDYQTFIYPGVLIQSALFSSIFFGVYIVWDKKIDFLKEVLVSPLSRTEIFTGKVVGGSTDTLIQIVILLLFGFGFTALGMMPGIQLNPYSIFVSLVFLLVTAIATVSIGLILGSQMESPEGFQLVSSFVVFPMFFLSGAFFPVDNLPAYLAPFVYVNPVTYSVDGIRGALVGASAFPMELDLAVICAFAVLLLFAGTRAFERMRL